MDYKFNVRAAFAALAMTSFLLIWTASLFSAGTPPTA